MTNLERIWTQVCYPLFCSGMMVLLLYGVLVGRDEFNKQMREVYGE